MAASDSDKAMFQIAQNEILTTDVRYYQASATLQVKQDLEAAWKKILELEKFLKDLKAELRPLKEADKEAEGLRARVNKLKGRLQNQEADLTQKLNEKADEEKMAIVQDMMEDTNAIMKMTWATSFPDTSYEKWGSQFAVCSDQFNKKIMGQEDGEEDVDEEAFDFISGESDQEEEEKQEADGDEEPPQEEADADKEHAPVDDPNQAAVNLVGPPPTA
ncbi:midasin-like [Chenopodium quinoa]|uniref:midasin-like n=1 Tax=Chenopodium quinoa TaxID=63459 RepID=UPI000B77E678|nr:midasin-like [Chenopodium quinoa]